MIVNIEAKRIFFISDTHLGVRNNSNEWIEQTREYFFDWFFPLVRENYKSGDVLFHLGDYFDSRQSINLKVLNLGIEIAEEMSKIFKDGVYIIIGNHDLWNKSTNEINSLKAIKWVPGINVFEEPVTLMASSKSIFMMPWRKDYKTDGETLDSIEPHDILCCHTDIRGLRFNRYSNVEEGSDLSKFSKFGRVYSGHIHYAQRQGNINMLGSPYEITRSDMDNKKGITLLDLGTMKETYFQNDFSPKFKKIMFKDILELTPEELEPIFRNNFIDILIDPALALKSQLGSLTDIMTSQRSLKFHPYDDKKATSLTEQMMDVEGRQFAVIDFIKEYVNNMDNDQTVKDKLLGSLNKLYIITTNKDQEDRIS